MKKYRHLLITLHVQRLKCKLKSLSLWNEALFWNSCKPLKYSNKQLQNRRFGKFKNFLTIMVIFFRSSEIWWASRWTSIHYFSTTKSLNKGQWYTLSYWLSIMTNYFISFIFFNNLLNQKEKSRLQKGKILTLQDFDH